ncbi:type II toxin-antitoxin system VapC family toxin [Phocaeicola salanitronis]|uniref:type II toxin-antitoxin system VapC family toxin n=1 Tax=Phocaeicola salanitronis TaxID=376805 RepID=UPI0023F989AA|nr:type II toxin-antitoxin system VapC family toxin [Phocaeicola salanitronis]
MKQYKYLLDSNICIHLLRGRKEVYEHLKQVGWTNCCISEITVIELLYGAECSNAVEENKQEVLSLCADLEVVPISDCIMDFVRLKAILRKQGALIDDFDLLIGATAITGGFIMVTENTRHLARIPDIRLENWINR